MEATSPPVATPTPPLLQRLLLQPSQSWAAAAPANANVWLPTLLVVLLAAAVLLRRPALPANAPAWFRGGDWPLLGALCFFSARSDYFRDAVRHVSGGDGDGDGKGNGGQGQRRSFSFYIGRKRVVGMAGEEGRRAFFESRDLNFGAGFAELLTGQPVTNAEADNFNQIFNKSLATLMRKENLAKTLGALTSDTRRACEKLLAAPLCADGKWRVTDPFESLYEVVYQLTMRTVGADDIAEDPALLRYTLAQFEYFEEAASTARVYLPWLLTPWHFIRLYRGARLAMVFQRLAEKRRATGKRGTDALQYLLDQGLGLRDIVTFQISSLYAGQLNSGINAAHLQCFLAASPEWLTRVRAEVDGAIERHRAGPEQSRADVLGTLTMEHWEAEFPLVDLCLRESIRLVMPGAAFRKNTTGRDLPIGATGEVIPAGAFAAYMVDDVMLDPDVYAEPMKFDPGRYLEDRAEDRKVPHAYVGWGAGRHPCLGMRFAKLEMSIITAYFLAMVEFEISDSEGRRTAQVAPMKSLNSHSAKKPSPTAYLRYRPRE
ncbi:cytochrome P450 6A1 [Xylariaceae sp. FL0804]|nr:cytochrome P450 6A1 [Xylariaceae sp. FL0804]